MKPLWRWRTAGLGTKVQALEMKILVASSEIVNITTLDALVVSDIDPMHEYIIDFLSIDAEGYDPAVLDGALQTLPFVRALAFEYSTWDMRGNARLQRHPATWVK